MSKSIPGINELLNAFVEDCYNYLVSICSEDAKNSIYRAIEERKNNSEISNKLYILELYINDKEITNGRNEDILLLAKNYIKYIYEELSKIGVNEEVKFISDYCLAYLALVSFRYSINEKSIKDENFYVFDLSSYTNFSALLDNYMIKNQIKEKYEENSKIIRDKVDKVGINKYTELFQIFDRNHIYLKNYEKKVVEINQIEAKKVDDGKEKQEEEIITLALKNEIDTMKLEMKFNYINLKLDILVTNEKLICESIINSSLLKLGKIKDEYLDTIIYHLKDTVTKLTNPYNINLWRKASNIILKNLFVILKKKGYSICQNAQKSILNNLRSYAKKNNMQNNDEFIKKILAYENKLNSKISTITKNQSSAADKDSSFNLITLYKDNSPEIIGSLCIDFLFYLKELGNKVAHFDEKIVDLILFDDLDIKEIKIFDDSNNNYNNLTIEYTGKKEFTGDEMLLLLKNPLQFQRKNIEIKDLFKNIYKQIDEFKKNINYQENKGKIDELEKEADMLYIKIKELYNNYKAYFQKNKINIKNLIGIEKNEDMNSDIKENIKHYIELKNIDEIISNKKKFCGEIKEKYNDMKVSSEYQITQINGYITDIKNAIKKTSKLIDIKDIFDNYKEDLKEKIFKEEEYIENKIIFNQENIDLFTIDKLYEFIRCFLNSVENSKYSIVKRDITNYNLYAEIIETFNELKYAYEKDVDLLRNII